MKKKNIIIFLSIIIILIAVFFMFKLDVFLVKNDFGTIYYLDFVSGSESSFNYYKTILRRGEKYTLLSEKSSIGRDKLFFIDRQGKEYFVSDETLRQYLGTNNIGSIAEIEDISSDNRLALIYVEINPSLMVYDLVDSKIITELKMEKGAYLTHGNFSNDSKSFVYGYNGTIYEFNLENNKSIEIASGDRALFSSDGKLISIIRYYNPIGGKIDIIDRQTKKNIYSFEIKKGIFQMFWTNDSEYLILSMQQGPLWTLMNIYIYSMKDGQLHKIIKNPIWAGGLPRGTIYKHEY